MKIETFRKSKLPITYLASLSCFNSIKMMMKLPILPCAKKLEILFIVYRTSNTGIQILWNSYLVRCTEPFLPTCARLGITVKVWLGLGLDIWLEECWVRAGIGFATLP